MREGGANPDSQSHDSNRPSGNWTDTGEPYYDVGLFQINNRHANTVASRYNGDMRKMLDVDKNYDMFLYLSDNLTDLLDWALAPDGVTFDWTKYEDEDGWPYSWVPDTETRHAQLLKDYKRYNINSLGSSSNGWPILKNGDSRLQQRSAPGIRMQPLYMNKHVLPLFLAFCADLQKQVGMSIDASPDDVSFSPKATGFPMDNLASGTAVWVNTRGSGKAVPSSDSVYRYWLNNGPLRTKLGQLLDSYDLIHWAGPSTWGGHTSTSGGLSVVYPLGLFYLKSGVSESDIKTKLAALNISASGVRKGALPNGPN